MNYYGLGANHRGSIVDRQCISQLDQSDVTPVSSIATMHRFLVLLDMEVGGGFGLCGLLE